MPTTYPFLSTSGRPISFFDIQGRNVPQKPGNPVVTFETLVEEQILRTLGVIDLSLPKTTEQLN